MLDTTDHPPQLAAALVKIFAPVDQSDAITGDLDEEFVQLRAQLGHKAAKGWYWRQSVNTVGDLVRPELWRSWWLIIVSVFGAHFVRSLVLRSYSRAVMAVLDPFRVYETHPDLYLYFFNWGFIGMHLLVSFLLGGVVAAIAKNREMIMTISWAAVNLLLILAGNAFLAAHHRQIIVQMQLWSLASAVAIVAGGVVVRLFRIQTWRSRTKAI